MIKGVGVDLLSIERISRLSDRYGQRLAHKILSSDEQKLCAASGDPVNFLAKSFAAKEAFCKAMGTGLRAPFFARCLSVAHSELGQPFLCWDNSLDQYLAGKKVHLSLSDQADFVLAFVVVEIIVSF